MSNKSENQNGFAGIDVGRTTIRAVVTSGDGNVLLRREANYQPEDLVAEIAKLVSELREKSPLKAVGVGIPGLVNRETDRVLMCTGLPSAVRGDMHAELMKATGLRIELENDANAAAYGEHKAGAGREARDLFYIGIGDSIGGAIILDGKLWTGASGCAGEIGHITIDVDGAECVCGNTGCLETVASGPNIVRRALERLNRDSTSSLSKLGLRDDFTAEDIAREAKNGDDFAAMMLERTGRSIGIAVASMINLLSIERVIIGGPIMEAGEFLLDP